MSRRAGSGRRVFWGLLSILVIAGVFYGLYRYRESKRPKIAYRPATVERGEIRSTILATGVVAPENRLDLKPQVAGRVEKVLVQEGDFVKAGQILAWLSSTERATLIDTARSQSKEELDYWENAYKMSPLLAPKRGLIILKNADSGQTVTQSDIILSMSDRLIAKVNVDETDLAQIQLKQAVTLVLDAFPGDPMPAAVVHIGFDAKTVNNVTTYEVDVSAVKPPTFMKSGMTVNATFLIAERKDVLIVPASAIHRKGGKSFVLIPAADPAEPPQDLQVTVGLSDGKHVEIENGLKEGDTILLASLASFAKEEKSGSPLSPFGGHGPPRH